MSIFCRDTRYCIPTGGLYMNLIQVNQLWTEFKERFDLDSDVMISAVVYDTDENVEGCFDLHELLAGRYILHLNPRFHLYSESYIRFILFHEFTHFYDFIKCDLDSKEDFFLYMNAYSEFHACKVTLTQAIEMYKLETVDVDKIQIPGPFREVSIRRLLSDSLMRVKISYEEFLMDFVPNDFVMTFRQLMYLYGYISLFKKDEILVEQTLMFLQIKDENYMKLYQELSKDDIDVDQILFLTREIYHGAFLMFLKDFIRRNYDDSLISDEDIENLTTENYKDYLEELDEKQEAIDAGEDDLADGMAAFCIKI